MIQKTTLLSAVLDALLFPLSGKGGDLSPAGFTAPAISEMRNSDRTGNQSDFSVPADTIKQIEALLENEVETSPETARGGQTTPAADESGSNPGVTPAAATEHAITRMAPCPPGVETWTARTDAEANQWSSVTYGADLFVAVATSGTNRVMTSPDGITWTARTAAEATFWRSVTYGAGLFVAVAVGGTNRVMTSPDGITWTSRTAAAANSWVSVTYGAGLFVALASGGTNRVMTSPDGITWTARTAAEANSWNSLTYGNGLFVAVAVGGTNRVMTSPDGITWTARAAATESAWTSVTYGSGLFVAVSPDGTNRVMTSSNAITPTVSITATPTNGGATPSWQWKKNNVDVGANSPTYTDNTLANGDVITVVMTSSDLCANPAAATSDAITMTVCPLQGISANNLSTCDGKNTTCTTDDTYTADITVTYADKPGSGTLSLSGPTIAVAVAPVDIAAIGATSHTFSGVTMLADGGSIDLTATFSEGCSYQENAVASAPACSASNCSITGVSSSNVGACNDNGTLSAADDYFVAGSIKVTFANAPSSGNLVIKRGNTVLGTKPAAELSCVTEWLFLHVLMTADGQLLDITAEFTGTTCALTQNLGSAPASCSCQPTTAFTACPTGLTVDAMPGGCVKAVEFIAEANGLLPAPTYTYIFTGATTGTGNGTGSGSTFPKGVTQVSVQAANDCGMATCNFSVTVQDNEKPTIACPADQTISADANCGGAVGAYSATSTSDNCATTVTVTQSPASTTALSGHNDVETVTLTADDGNGNTENCTFTVTLQDVTGPTITGALTAVVLEGCAPDVPAAATTVAELEALAGTLAVSDNCDADNALTVSHSDAGAATAPIALTRTYTVTDATGNTSTVSQTITSYLVKNQNSGARFNSIQDAVNAASSGDVLTVCSGTYNEDLVVNKNVDLRGANYGMCYDDEDRGAESTIAGTVTLSAAGASLDGFRLTKRSNSTTSDGILFSNWSGLSLQVTGVNTAVRNNIVEMYGGAVGSNHAVLLNAPGAVTFQCNEVLGGAGYLAENDPRGMSAVRLTNTASNYTVSGNRIGVSTGRSVPGADADAVSFFNAGNVHFDGNLVQGNILGGLVLYGQIDDIAITNNTIENYAHTGIRVINMLGYNSATADVTISGNFLNGGDGTTGIGILDAPASDIALLRSNSITGNTKSIEFTGTGTLAATCNWYGTTDVALIAASLDTTISPGVNTNVTCEPFLSSGVDANPAAAGFQPSAGAQPGYVSAVAGGGQPISKGSTTYSATNLTLMGSAPVGGSIIRNYSFTAATSCGGASGVTFTSLTFTGAAAARFILGGIVAGTEYAPGTFSFIISYQSHTAAIEDEVTCVMTTASGVYTFKLKAVTVPPSPAVAEIRGNSVLITNGDFTPGVSDHTDFGVLSTQGTLARTFTLTNAGPTGCNPLSLTGGTPITFTGGDAGKFTVTTNTCTAPLASGASCTFTVTFSSGTTTGIANTMIQVANSDAARNPYEYSIRAELQAPNLSFTGNNTVIANGDNTPEAADYTLMGSAVAGQTITRSYTLKNLGLGNLLIGSSSVTLSAASNGPGHTNFAVATQPVAGTYSTNQETFFTLRFTSPGPGSYYALVTFVTGNAGTYTFVVQGNGPTPRMQVVGNNADIPSGSTTVSAANDTEYGERSLNTNLDRTFTVRNPGSLGAAAPLSLTGSPLRVTIGGPGVAMFSVTTQPGASVGVNGSSIFRVRYRPTAAGCHTATVTIPSNDPSRNPYTFNVRGRTPGASCPDYAPLPGGEEEYSVADEYEVALSDGAEDIQAISRGLDGEASEMMLYPNPATDRVLLEAPESAESRIISFINIGGVTVYSFETTGGFHSLDLTDFAPGVYVVVSSDRRIAPKRLIKL